MNVLDVCSDVDALNVALISPAKISHLHSWCLVSLLMSKFVHCICGHTFGITPLHLFMWLDLFLTVFAFVYLFCVFCVAQLSGLWTRDQVRQNWKGLFSHNVIFHLLPYMNKSKPKSILLPLRIINMIYCGVLSHAEGHIRVHTALLSVIHIT